MMIMKNTKVEFFIGGLLGSRVLSSDFTGMVVLYYS